MSEVPDLSIIVVNWNGKELLSACLPSLVSDNDKVNVQVIVVDNGSEDGSVSWCRENYNSIEIVALPKNIGFSGANNEGIKYVKGKYVMLLNNDTIVQNNALEILVEYMNSHPEVAGCGPTLLNEDMSLQRSVRKFPTLWTEFCQESGLSFLFPRSHIFADYYMGYWDHNETKKVDLVIGAALLIRKEVLDNVGLLDDKNFFMFYEEVDWFLRFKNKGYVFVYLEGPKIIHVGGGTSSQQSKQSRYNLLHSRYNYHSKHHGKISAIFLFLIHMLFSIIYAILFGFFSAFNINKTKSDIKYNHYMNTLKYHKDKFLKSKAVI